MEWKEFKQLEINNQIEIFNNLIKEHGSITKAANSLGISDSTVRKYFKSLGYSFKDNKYIKDINTQVDSKTSLMEPVCENKPHIDITELEQIVNDLIDKRLADLKQTKSSIELSSECEGDVKYRSYGVYKTISDRFDKYVERHRLYNKIQILSEALLRFMNENE